MSKAAHTPELWEVAACAMGWRYADAYGGWIADHYFDPETGQHPSELTAEDACFVDGIETEDDARAILSKLEGRS